MNIAQLQFCLVQVFECLNAYAETNDLFPSLQFGFHKGLGTCDAHLTITSAVPKSLDTGCEVYMIGLQDFSVASDHVYHWALLFKAFLNIIMELLTGRKHC